MLAYKLNKAVVTEQFKLSDLFSNKRYCLVTHELFRLWLRIRVILCNVTILSENWDSSS
jgi:hypothetical protein